VLKDVNNTLKQKRDLYVLGEPLKMATQTNLTESQQWVIALGALLPANFGHWLNIMSTGEPLESMKEGLARWWGLDGRESYFEAEESLSRLPSKEDYEAVWSEIRDSFKGYACMNSKIKSASDALVYVGAGAHHTLTGYWKTKRAIQRLDHHLVEINGSPLKEKFKTSMHWYSGLAYSGINAHQVTNLSAWDISRFVYISRNACELGWISEAEYFELCAPAALTRSKQLCELERLFRRPFCSRHDLELRPRTTQNLQKWPCPPAERRYQPDAQTALASKLTVMNALIVF
jgi:hypothetical protein